MEVHASFINGFSFSHRSSTMMTNYIHTARKFVIFSHLISCIKYISSSVLASLSISDDASKYNSRFLYHTYVLYIINSICLLKCYHTSFSQLEKQWWMSGHSDTLGVYHALPINSTSNRRTESGGIMHEPA